MTNKSPTLLATIAPALSDPLEMSGYSLEFAAEWRIALSNNASQYAGQFAGAVSTLDGKGLLRLQHGCLVFTCHS
jgi:hypothetical protein